MKSYISAELLTATGALAFFKITFIPDANLIIWVFISILLDLVTGIIKAIILNNIRTSSGYRKTVIKFTQYAGAIAVGTILGNVLSNNNIILSYVNSGLLILLIYIEATSIFENLYAIDNSSPFSKYFIAPILRILTIAIKKTSPNQVSEDEK